VRETPAIAAAAVSMLVLAEGACGTDQWVFDAPDQAVVEGGTALADVSVLETSTVAESGQQPETGVADARPVPGGDARADSDATPQTGCSSDTDCASAGMHCDTTSGQCVQCVADGDCGRGLVCESLQCVASCANGAACPAATPVCRQPGQVCVPCGTNSDCVPATTGPICLTSTGQCVECVADADCQDGFCDTTTNACVRV
jgi:Cys-rich repeat protein